MIETLDGQLVDIIAYDGLADFYYRKLKNIFK